MNLMNFHINNLDRSTIFEIILRLILWYLFLHFDKASPFIREIKQEELWLYQYPVTRSYVPARYLWATIFIYPSLFLIVECFLTRKTEDPVAALLTLSLSYSLNGFLTTLIKVWVGRPRPDFFYRCFPDGTGTDVNKCTGYPRAWLDGRKSFPSGHSSFSFACMVFMSMYTARKLELFHRGKRGQSWQLCCCIMPLLVAAGISISRTCDYHHHYEDVISGAALGTVLSYLCYKLYFPTENEA